MAQLGENFDANSVDPSAPRDLLLPGEYIAQIVKSDMETPKSGSGKMLTLEFDIVDGECKGRKIWVRLNLVHSSADTEKYARADLSAICHAVGELNVSDSEKLHFKPLLITVKVKPAGPDKNGVQREAQNEVKGYKAAPRGGYVAPARTAAPAAVRQDTAPVAAAAETSGGAPWRRKTA